MAKSRVLFLSHWHQYGGLLAFVEPVLRPILPVTAGQLALFANDSTASPNWLHDRLKERMHSVEETIATLVSE